MLMGIFLFSYDVLQYSSAYDRITGHQIPKEMVA